MTILKNELKQDYDGIKIGDHYLDAALYSANSNSRISREFEILDFIGKGAYGDVLKVRNKLDDCHYAIKRIHLNPRNKQLNRKIIREVQLLSRLNHENVVRYYNSWLEECFDDANLSVETSLADNDLINKNKQGREDIRLPPQKENLSFSFSRPNLNPSFSDDEDDDDDDDDECEWISFVQNTDSNSSKTQSDITESTSYEQNTSNDKVECSVGNQFLYIQMEYCEKSTLRNAIDNNLYLEQQRVWRLLREIVEGLAYIHQQGIIHRDLKPVNIFIDSEDHVKIGDFGLATPNKHIVAVKCELTLTEKADENNINNSELETSDTSHTGQIGTALYVSPELNSGNLTVIYNQKVDIYSLGVIFFEMCHRPLNTEMERFKVLTNLRQYSRNLPPDFLKPEYSRQIKLIRDLLNHNPKERPSAQEILQNKEYIPAAELEDSKFIDTIHHTLSTPQSKTYKRLISECFNQKVSAAEDIIFDSAPYGKIIWHHSIIEKITQTIREIFQLHGGTYLSTSLLMPKSANFTIPSENAVSLMTRYGALVNMPYDLRMPFARYLAQNPLIIHLKRYSIEKVYREHRMFGIHPKEMFESTFDIVSSLPYNLSVEAELLSIAYEFLQKFPISHNRNYLIRLNHSSLITGILLHCRVKTEKHAHICDWLNRNKTRNNFDNKNNTTHCIPLENCDIPENILSKIISIMGEEIPFNGIYNHFDDIVRKQSGAASHCKHGIRQLETLAKLLIHLDIQCPVVIAPNLITNIQYYSGVMFQIVWNKKDGKNRNDRDIIATGGRYDPLIATYRKALNITKETTQTAAGISIFIDRLVTVFQTNLNSFSTIDVLVCSVGEIDMIEEKLKIIKDLWSAGIRSTILNSKQSLEETQSYCKEMNISHIIFVKESEIGTAGVRSLQKDRFCEKKMPVTEIVDYLQKTMKSINTPLSNSNTIGGNITNSASAMNVGSVNNSTYSVSPHHHYARSDSKNDGRMINVIFLTEEKYTNNSKRRYENQISNTVSNSLHKISPKSKIDILALNAEGEFIKQLIANIDINDKNDFASLVKRFPRYKKDLKRIINYVDELQLKDNPLPVIIFYSLLDSTFKILL